MLSQERRKQMEQATPEQLQAIMNPSQMMTRICKICDDVSAIDGELKQLKYKRQQLDNVVDVLRSSWKMDADAIRSTDRHDTNTIRLEKIEAIDSDIDDLTKMRTKLINEAMTLFKQLKEYEKPYAALVLDRHCDIAI